MDGGEIDVLIVMGVEQRKGLNNFPARISSTLAELNYFSAFVKKIFQVAKYENSRKKRKTTKISIFANYQMLQQLFIFANNFRNFEFYGFPDRESILNWYDGLSVV